MRISSAMHWWYSCAMAENGYDITARNGYVVSTIAENEYCRYWTWILLSLPLLKMDMLGHSRWACYIPHNGILSILVNSHLVSVIAGDSSKADGLNQPLQEELQTVNNGVFFCVGFFLTTVFPQKVGFLCGEVFYLGYGWPPALKPHQVHLFCSCLIILLAHPSHTCKLLFLLSHTSA